ncbi:hypothetical protein [Lysinibacter cavernae]|uniref:Uncharacterized protein n=1 Tax=Lysinibacter cavernae TaxID=1640652 RepID=A0A7X5QYW2_9MICO|nr:hypothetical protein [Lysinibacter cavernae]NIH52533.1 hypothetical protein [Lysinibacter cavernae]
MTEIPDDVIEAAAKAAWEANAAKALLSPNTPLWVKEAYERGWEGVIAERKALWIDSVRSEAPVIAAWAREQALAEAHEAVRCSIVSIGPEGPSDQIHEAMYNGGCDALRAVAALRGKEGEPRD